MKHLPILIIAALLMPAISSAETTHYAVNPGGDNLIRFVSKAPGETFDGVTDQVQGMFTVDPEDLTKPVSGQITVQAKTLDTGIGLRNNDMYENHLHVEQYPTIVFELTGVENPPEKLPVGEEVELTATGNFTLHGVTRQISPQLTIKRNADDSLWIDADWKVTLSDYEIPRPQFLFLKLAEEQQVNATFTAIPK